MFVLTCVYNLAETLRFKARPIEVEGDDESSCSSEGAMHVDENLVNGTCAEDEEKDHFLREIMYVFAVFSKPLYAYQLNCALG